MPKTAAPAISKNTNSKSSTAKSSTKRKTAKPRKRASALACAANGAGWCAYPFSIEQLEKRLKMLSLAKVSAAR